MFSLEATAGACGFCIVQHSNRSGRAITGKLAGPDSTLSAGVWKLQT